MNLAPAAHPHNGRATATQVMSASGRCLLGSDLGRFHPIAKLKNAKFGPETQAREARWCCFAEHVSTWTQPPACADNLNVYVMSPLSGRAPVSGHLGGAQNIRKFVLTACVQV